MTLEQEIAKLTANDPPGRKAQFASDIRHNVHNWEAMIKADPELGKLELAIAHCARILITEDYSSPQYAEALRQDWKLREKRVARAKPTPAHA